MFDKNKIYAKQLVEVDKLVQELVKNREEYDLTNWNKNYRMYAAFLLSEPFRIGTRGDKEFLYVDLWTMNNILAPTAMGIGALVLDYFYGCCDNYDFPKGRWLSVLQSLVIINNKIYRCNNDGQTFGDELNGRKLCELFLKAILSKGDQDVPLRERTDGQ